MTPKKLMQFFTIKAYRLYSKSFKQSLLAITTTIFWLTILVLKKVLSFWPQNTID